MALQISISVRGSTDGLGVVFTDSTGLYSSTNLGGYGTINPDVSDVTAYSVDFTIPDSTTYQLSNPPTIITIDLFALGFPTISTITIPNTAFGLASTATLPDGIWNADATATGTTVDGAFSSTTDADFALYYNARCCSDGKIAEHATCTCTKFDATDVKIIKMDMALDVVDYLVECGQIAKAGNVIAFAKQTCAQIENCDSGCAGCS